MSNDLREGHRAFFQQAGILEELDAGVAALFAGAAVDVPDAQIFVTGGDGIDQFGFGFGQQP